MGPGSSSSARRTVSPRRRAGSIAPRISRRGGVSSRRSPRRARLVLLFEDLHWAGRGPARLRGHLVEWATAVPMLVVCTARPELLVRRPSWGGGKPNAVTVSLTPLSDDETALLLDVLIEQAVLAPELQSTLVARAGGNPLYAEEFVRMLAERGGDPSIEELPVPASVQGIISARLDTLEPDEKVALQDAAVVGRVFWLGAVSHLGGVPPPGSSTQLFRAPRAKAVHPAPATVHGRAGVRVRVPPPARPGRGLRPDSAQRPRGEAPPGRRVGRLARTSRGSRRDVRLPLPAGTRVRARVGRLDGDARATGARGTRRRR